MTIVEQYRGKNLLITGTTGFLGKVLLQKFLYSLPEVGVIYILIRKKKGLDLNQRFKKQVISSACFDRIRTKYGAKFDEFIENKIKPIQGDLEKDNVGLSSKDFQLVVNTCNIIINCAASIDFNQRLDGAIESNIKGSLRMQSLAKAVKDLDIFTHVSTCYVNCNLKGLIKQEIYASENDPEQQLKQLLSHPVKQLVANTTKILNKYPNTYTFTKALCERLLKKRRGDLPMCIVRPAIINTSYKEPFPGWLDSIAAAAAMFLFVGLGIIKQVRGNPNNIGDTIPVDVVVANIIVATARNLNKNGLPIYHVGSSDRNPITWQKARDSVCQFWNANPSTSRVSKSQVLYSQNQKLIQMYELKRRIPVLLYTKMAPFMGKQHQKNAEKMMKTFERGSQIKKVFEFFVRNQWIYQAKKVKDLLQFMNPEEKQTFIVDAADIDIDYFLIVNNYGLQKYILKENIELPSPQNYNLLKLKNQGTYFSDIKWALNSKIQNIVKPTNPENIKTKILSSTRVLSVIQDEALKMVEKKATNLQDQRRVLSKQAQRIVNDMIGQIKMPVIRFLAWSLHKIFGKIYEKVNINNEQLKKIKQIQETQNIPIVFMPTHKSYIDFLIVSYILFVNNQKLPYIVSDEALLSANIIPFLIRSSGAFFYKKKQYKNSRLYNIIFNKYIELLLRDGHNLEFFIEGTRSRTGKILRPQFEILNIIFDTVLNDKVNDVCLVPLTINYEKVLEGDTFPSELLGQQKVAESLLRVIKAYPLLKVNFGRVYVQICDPISIRDQIKKFGDKKALENISNKQEAVQNLGKQIVYEMTNKLVIMSTGIVSCVLLMNRKGITEQNLIKSVNWISKYILTKGYKIGGINQNSSAIAVRNAISYLQQITTKTKKNIFELQISAGQDFQKILMLSYYRNTIVHTFLPEAFVSCSIAAFGTQLSSKEGVKINRLFEETALLMDLLREEYLIPYNLQDKETFALCLRKMIENGILLSKQDDKDKILIHPKGDKLISLHFSLLRSLLECYWATIIYLVSLLKNEDGQIEVGSYDKFYDMIQWQVESMYQQRVIAHYQACSLQTIKNAIQTFSRMKFVKLTESMTKKRQIRIEVLVKQDFLESFGQRIMFFLKNSYQSSIISPLQLARNTKGAQLSKL